MNLGTKSVPSIIDLRHWQFGQIMGDRSFTAACQVPAVGEMLKQHLDEPLNLQFLPLANSLLPKKQANYNFLIEGRTEYGFPHLNLEGQEIMMLESAPGID